MGFRKSVKFGPFRMTVSKSGISTSFGIKGARVTKLANGRVRTTFSVPGTGISHVSESGSGKKSASNSGKSGHGLLYWIFIGSWLKLLYWTGILLYYVVYWFLWKPLYWLFYALPKHIIQSLKKSKQH